MDGWRTFTLVYQIITCFHNNFRFFSGLVSRTNCSHQTENRTGKLFYQEIDLLKVNLDDQIKEIHRYQTQFEDMSKAPGDIKPLSLLLLHKFEIIKSLDKIQLIKCLEKTHGNQSTQIVSTLYQMFFILDRDTERLDKIYGAYHAKFDQLVGSFVDEINALRLPALTERDRLGTNYHTDKFLFRLWELAFTQNTNLNINELIGFATELIPKLLGEKVLTDTTHTLYQPVLEFTVRSSKILNQYQNERKKFLGILRMSEDTFRSGHDTLRRFV